MRKPITRTLREPPPLPVWRHPRDRISVPKIGITLALSLILHVAMLWKLPQIRFPSFERSPPLTVRLVPPAGAPPAAPPRTTVARPPQLQQQPASKPAPVPRAADRPVREPPVIARAEPARRSPPPAARSEVPVAPAPPAPPPASRTSAPDLASYIEAQRRARGESPPAPSVPATAPTPPVEDANARANRIAAANLGLDRKPAFGPVRRSGGVFDVTHTGYDYAEFWFYGWNKDIQRDTAQKIEVRKGSAGDIRIAVVRRMIVIIREHEREDFTWESKRLDRMVTLSARLPDTAGLEAFLMREFYEDPRRPASR